MAQTPTQKREELADNFRTDPGRDLYETSIVGAKQEPMLRVTSPENGVASRILRHDEAKIEQVQLIDADDHVTSATLEDAYEMVEGEYDVTGVRALFPVGVLRLGKSARDSDRLADAIYSG